jgi:hypothetical protein
MVMCVCKIEILQCAPPPPPHQVTSCAVANHLRAFTKLRKATISFVISLCPSVRVEQLGPHWTNFHEILYLRIFRKSVEKIQFSLKSDKTNRCFT